MESGQHPRINLVLAFAQAILRTQFGLAIAARATKGDSRPTMALVLLVTSRTIPWSDLAELAKRRRRQRLRSTIGIPEGCTLQDCRLDKGRWTPRAMILVSGAVRLRSLESWRATRQLGPARGAAAPKEGAAR